MSGIYAHVASTSPVTQSILPTLQAHNFIVQFWTRPGRSAIARELLKIVTSPGGTYMRMRVLVSTIYSIECEWATGAPLPLTASPLSPGVWTHITYMVKSPTIYLYMDTVEQSTPISTLDLTSITSSDIYIGSPLMDVGYLRAIQWMEAGIIPDTLSAREEYVRGRVGALGSSIRLLHPSAVFFSTLFPMFTYPALIFQVKHIPQLVTTTLTYAAIHQISTDHGLQGECNIYIYIYIISRSLNEGLY